LGGAGTLWDEILQDLFGISSSSSTGPETYFKFQESHQAGLTLRTAGVPQSGGAMVLAQADSASQRSFTYKNAGGPVNSDLADMLDCFAKCTGTNLVVTGAKEPSPPHRPGSAHNTGEAADLGKNSNPSLTRSYFEGPCFEMCFNPFEEGVYGQEEGTHFHVQDRPGRNGSDGFAPGLH
jgi:hypothetical protein